MLIFCWVYAARLNEEQFTFQLQYKHSGTFANRKYGELFNLKKSENVRPHFSQSSRENATPYFGTSPLASYKEVLPLGGGGGGGGGGTLHLNFVAFRILSFIRKQ